MIDPAIIESLNDNDKALVKSCFVTILSSGVLEAQRARSMESIISGDRDEDPEELAKRIILHRRRQVGLDEFENLAKRFKGEIE